MDIVSYILNKNSIGEIQDEVDQIEEDLVEINTELDKKVNKDELGSSAYLDAPAIGDAADNEVVLGCDSRLTDARTPVAHTHLMNEIADLPTLGTVVTYDIPVMGDALANEVVMGDDTRLTDNRDPNPHNHVVADITDFPTLGTAAAKDYTSTYDPTSSDLVTGEAVGEAINSMPNPMIFKGSLGDGGTITQLPAPVAANEGFTYKVITEGTYAGVQAGIGDMFTCGDPDNDYIFEWVHFPSGDEPGGTVMSVKIQGSGAIAVDDESAITTSGVRTISHNDSGVTAGTYTSVTVDGKGHVTAGSNPDISYNDLTDKPTLGTAAALDIPVSGNASSSQVVKGDDSRLTDARTPVSHTHTLSEITDAGTAAALDVSTSGDASSTEVVLGSDTRLTDARTPVSHTHTTSEITDFPTLGTASALDVATTGDASSSQVVKGDDSRLTDARTPVSHTHTLSEVTDAGTAASKNVPTSGNASTTEIVMGNDSRLTDSRNAADVYSWAKAASKPSYTASEVGALADTIKYAGASTAGGAATSAEKLTNTSKIGDTNKPVYFSADGVPVAISYTIDKSVPSNAVFTDNNTTYTVATGDANGQIKVTPSSGSAYNVSVKGLDTMAYMPNNKIKDIGNAVDTTFAYSKAGLNYADYTWLAAWNGYELRAINKSQFLPSTGGTLTGELINPSGGIWVQGGSAAGGNLYRLTLSAGMPTEMKYGSGNRGTRLYSNGIAFCDPYNGTSNNDSSWIRHIEETANTGTLEIAVGDDAANESIVVRRYNTSSAVATEITLFNASGQSIFGTSIAVNPNLTGNYNEGLRLNRASNGWSVLTMNGAQNSVTGTGDNIWSLGCNSTGYNHKFFVGHNGCAESTTYWYVDSSSQKSPHLRIGGDLDVQNCKLQYNSTTLSLDFIFS